MDAHIQSYLRVAASRARDTERIGPFLATFSRRTGNPYLNYAIPDEDATPLAADVAALVAAYRSRGRTPRLEYLPSLAPAVEAALVAHGFAVEGRLPLMICAPGSARDLPVPAGIELGAPRSDHDLLAMVTVQNEAYGDSAPGPADLEGRRASLAAGGICDVPAGHTTELAGIGVRATFRRRGIAGALTARLVREARVAGVTTIFLMAAHEQSAGIYARVGFATTSQILHISLPRT